MVEKAMFQMLTLQRIPSEKRASPASPRNVSFFNHSMVDLNNNNSELYLYDYNNTALQSVESKIITVILSYQPTIIATLICIKTIIQYNFQKASNQFASHFKARSLRMR